MGDQFIHIRSPKFPVLPGEDEELVNEGMYGKALAEYLQTKLKQRGYDAPFIACEDWGWWIELKTAPFVFGVCIYCGPVIAGKPLDLFCTDGTTAPRQWSWKNSGASTRRRGRRSCMRIWLRFSARIRKSRSSARRSIRRFPKNPESGAAADRKSVV